MSAVLIGAGVIVLAVSVARDVGYAPGVIVGVVLIIVGWYRLITGPQRAAARRRRGRRGRIL